MSSIKHVSETIRQTNYRVIAENKECGKSISEMKKIEKFLDDFGFLSFDRDYILCRGQVFSLQMICTASELTAGSIISCCESGCIADAYSLLRKYRDDMFFYLYIVVYDACNKSDHKSSTVDQMETNIERWINNDLCDLKIGEVLRAIGQSPQAKTAVQKYNLKAYFDAIGNRLNNYVHSNGVSFYNRNAWTYHEETLQKQMQALLKDMRSITITFLFLVTLCSPSYIMSTDYIDYLDCNMTPPEGSQYWVAPFVEEFFNSNIDLIDKSCMQFLRDNTCMEFE